ncbi:hypothetical protein ANANG_G00129870 [Anguilla anguilla]|uniref:Uncharacterized protein n=1 Tax=Anguilla anguilla TaxID=7936 RepID=A0A9D3S2F0_ANGAN|nr:hypothetical protein ANANG_G00129870 [Anguilla anguilla]
MEHWNRGRTDILKNDTGLNMSDGKIWERATPRQDYDYYWLFMTLVLAIGLVPVFFVFMLILRD